MLQYYGRLRAAAARGRRLSERRRRRRRAAALVQGRAALDRDRDAHGPGRGTIACTGAGPREPGTYPSRFRPPRLLLPKGSLRAAGAARGGAVDTRRDGDRRPRGCVGDHAPLRRQLDARLPAGRADACDRPPTGGRASIRWTQTRAARVAVAVETPERRRRPHGLAPGRSRRGAEADVGRARRRTASRSPSGVYVVRVRRDELGRPVGARAPRSSAQGRGATPVASAGDARRGTQRHHGLRSPSSSATTGSTPSSC